ncbi:hypothetical protein C900_05855 [Fulvivirga imtechensis AK7]|uniref:Peptidase S74 domain-containing protein n=1 Tax=Fulvivirga imtechensis AK7 TaxID=1237149 RepID=L8JMQ7_9BACT|nr:hypothetical protein C900_05855 [Fulvivirga imtechensis AK7]
MATGVNAQTLLVPGGDIGNSNNRNVELIDGSILVKSDPYASIGLERTNGAKISMGITSSSTESFILSTGTLKFLTNADATPKMFITTNGRIGIGTQAPTQKFEVIDGSINVKSDPYSFIGVERLNGATIRMGVTSDSHEGHLSSSGSIKFLTNGDATPRMFINTNGRIGIGTNTPTQKLEVIDGSILVKSDPYASIGLERTNGAKISMGITSGSTEGFILSTGTLKFLTNADATPKMFISYNGNVGIGTSNATDKLTVAGNIHSREVKVTVNAGADFVFENDYSLPSLEDVSAFVMENKHLPEIPSEKEMLENGLELGEMNIKLLQKVEELTLYLIQQNELNKQLMEEVAELKVKVNELSKEK